MVSADVKSLMDGRATCDFVYKTNKDDLLTPKKRPGKVVLIRKNGSHENDLIVLVVRKPHSLALSWSKRLPRTASNSRCYCLFYVFWSLGN